MVVCYAVVDNYYFSDKEDTGKGDGGEKGVCYQGKPCYHDLYQPGKSIIFDLEGGGESLAITLRTWGFLLKDIMQKKNPKKLGEYTTPSPRGLYRPICYLPASLLPPSILYEGQMMKHMASLSVRVGHALL